jgi:hypothetical protein
MEPNVNHNNQTSAQIHKSTLRGGANFIVVSSISYFDDFRILPRK